MRHKFFKVFAFMLFVLTTGAFFGLASAEDQTYTTFSQIRSILRPATPEAEIISGSNDDQTSALSPRIRTVVRSSAPRAKIISDNKDTNNLATDVLLSYSSAEPNNLYWDSTFKEVSAINFNPSVLPSGNGHKSFKKMATSGTTFQIDGADYKIVQEKFEERGLDNYSWFGYVEDSQFLSHFAVYNGAVAGEIWLPNGGHRSVLTRGGQQFLVKWDEEEISRGLADDQIPDFSFGLGDTGAPGGTTHEIRRRLSSLSCPKGQELVWEKPLLYIYDTTALQWFRGDEDALQTFAQASADGVNAVHVNSLIPNYRVRLAGVREVKYTSAGELSADAGWMQISEEVADLKAKTGAIEVGFIIGTTEGMGVGLAGGGFADPDRHPPIHVFRAGGGVDTAIHEEGHNDGAGHQIEDWVGWMPAPFAYDWFKDGLGRGIMAIWRSDLCPNDCLALPVLSNPNVFVNEGRELGLAGVPVGVPGKAENWRMPALAYPAFGVNPVCK